MEVKKSSIDKSNLKFNTNKNVETLRYKESSERVSYKKQVQKNVELNNIKKTHNIQLSKPR